MKKSGQWKKAIAILISFEGKCATLAEKLRQAAASRMVD